MFLLEKPNYDYLPYQKHLSFKTDILLIFLTVWVILSPESQLPFKVFKHLPKRNF
jgi:hypothetical protein